MSGSEELFGGLHESSGGGIERRMDAGVHAFAGSLEEEADAEEFRDILWRGGEGVCGELAGLIRES